MQDQQPGTAVPHSEADQSLTQSQRRALALAFAGGTNIFITGGAGTGKSTVVRKIIDVLQSMNKNVRACATTGVAAMNIDGGQTIHAAFRLPAQPCIMDDGSGKGMRLRVSTPGPVRMADVVLIDEVSLASPDLFDTVVLSIRKAAEETGRPKSLIVVGDFFQLCPTLPDAPVRTLLEAFYGAKHDNWYAFMGKCWDECNFQVVYLTEVVRQRNGEFVRCLNQARRGDPSCLGYLNASPSAMPAEGSVSLFAYKQKVLENNHRRLESLEGDLYSYGTRVSYEMAGASKMARQIASEAPGNLFFKQGAQILFTATDYGGTCSSRVLPQEGRHRWDGRPNFVNGMTGSIVEVRQDSVLVKAENGHFLDVRPMTRPLYVYQVNGRRLVKERVASYTQYPFTLAYALTIHRAQGLTLGHAIVDPDTFAPGQLYVALSRVSSKEGLFLTRPVRHGDLKVDPSVLRFYERLEKMAGISGKKGRPVKNTDGTKRSATLWVPKPLVEHVREEIRQNRILELPTGLGFTSGRTQIRVTEEMHEGIRHQIESWRAACKDCRN